MTNAFLWSAGATGFTALLTALGASVVFLFRRPASPILHRTLLGFAAGVMIAASMWSLLIPAIEQAEVSILPSWLPAAGGFALGILFLLVMDLLLPLLQPAFLCRSGTLPSHHRAVLFILAVTMHNIPEGMAVGISFANAAHQQEPPQLAAALALAFGIGIQNFPEGAAIALPLCQEGMSRPRAFLIGALSGVVEPIFGLLTVFIAGSVQPLMPWLLSFAAGAMLYVVVEELIPEANITRDSHTGTLSVMVGFLIMMVLDVALG